MDVPESEAARFFLINAVLQLCKLFCIHTGPVVPDAQQDVFTFPAAGDGDQAPSAAVFDTRVVALLSR